MISPLASLTKPESIGCWINAWTSVVSPLEIARTRMVDAIRILPSYNMRMIVSENRFRPIGSRVSAAAAADRHFDFLGRAVELAAGFDDRGHIAGLLHFDAIGHARHRARQNLVGRRQRVWIFRDQEGDRGHIGKYRAGGDRNHRAV